MKRFIYKIIIILFPLVAIVYSKPIYFLLNGKFKSTILGNEVYGSLEKSKKKASSRKLLIGDSVGKQLFPIEEENEKVNSLACNQAIGMIGQYILLKNYLNAGNEIDTLYLLTTPFSFKNNLDQIYTYQYFAKPFYNKQYKNYFTEKAIKQLNKIPYISLCQEPNILISNWSPEFTSSDSVNFTFLSPLSIEYLEKIRTLSRKHNFQVVTLPVPISYVSKDKVENINKNEIRNAGLDDIFKNFFRNIRYVNDTHFIDHVHFKDPIKFKAYYNNL